MKFQNIGLIILFIFTLIIFSGAVTASTLSDGPQPKYRHDNYNSAQSPYTGPQTGHIKWIKKNSLGNLEEDPIIAKDGTIYFSGVNGYLYAFRSSGSFKFKIKVGTSILATPAIDKDGIIYVRTAITSGYKNAESITAIKPSGTIKWNCRTTNWVGYHVGSSKSSSPAIGSDGTIYFGDTSGKFYAISPLGKIKWKHQTISSGGASINSSPAIGSDGTIYFGNYANYLYAMRPNGTLKWTYKAGFQGIDSVSIGRDGTIYFGSNDWLLYALSPNRTLKWTYKVGSSSRVIAPSIGKDGTLYMVNGDDLYALTPNKKLKWRYNNYYDLGSSPTIGADGTIYIGGDDYSGSHSLAVYYALRPSNGSIKWKRAISGIYGAAPAIGSNHALYFTTNGYTSGSTKYAGYLTCLRDY